MGAIMVGGKLYELLHPVTRQPMPVRRWNDWDYPVVPEFKAGDGYNKKRVKPIDLFVFHWTGGEQDPIPMAETLRQRKLGVEFAISRGGTVYQFCDPLVVDTADAGIVNSRSIGCEIVNYGYRSVWDLRHAFGVPKLGQDREMYAATTHNSTVQTSKFYPCQMDAAFALANAISGAIPAITRRVPDGAGVLNVSNTNVLPNIGVYSGFIGHYQLTKEKRDPGPWFMEELGKQLKLPIVQAALA